MEVIFMKALSLFLLILLVFWNNAYAGYSTFREAEKAAKRLYYNDLDSFVAIWYVSQAGGRIAAPDIPQSTVYESVTPDDRGNCVGSDHSIPCYVKTGYYVQQIGDRPGKTGHIPHLSFQHHPQDVRNNLVAVHSLGSFGTTSLHKAFADCPNLRYVRYAETSEVTDMSGMFRNATGLRWVGTPPVNGISSLRWDTSKVKDMSGMFHNTHKKTPHRYILNLNHLDVSQVENMDSMFFRSGFKNILVRDWEVSGVKNMAHHVSGDLHAPECVPVGCLRLAEYILYVRGQSLQQLLLPQCPELEPYQTGDDGRGFQRHPFSRRGK